MDDPLNEAPELTIYNSTVEIEARKLADKYVYMKDETDPRGLTVMGTDYAFTTADHSREAMIHARFIFVRALVTFARMQTAQQSARALASACGGDA